MSEQRLVDANELFGIESLLNTDIVQKSKEASWLMDQVLHDIQAMPTIEAKPVIHGRWSRCAGNKYRCTNCGRHTNVDEVMELPVYNYCPYCGAKMEV